MVLCTRSWPGHYFMQPCGLKERLAEIIPSKVAEVKEFRAAHGDKSLGQVTVDQVSTAVDNSMGLVLCR